MAQIISSFSFLIISCCEITLGFSGTLLATHPFNKIIQDENNDWINQGNKLFQKFYSFGSKKIKLIKIDIEGHEFEALQGMKKLLNNNNSLILLEFCEESISKRQKIINFLKH